MTHLNTIAYKHTLDEDTVVMKTVNENLVKVWIPLHSMASLFKISTFTKCVRDADSVNNELNNTLGYYFTLPIEQVVSDNSRCFHWNPVLNGVPVKAAYRV